MGFLVTAREAALAKIVSDVLKIAETGDVLALVDSIFIKEAEQALKITNAPIHPDDIAAESFCNQMRLKLEQKREEGYGGWDNPEVCTEKFLAELLIDHLKKGDPVDIGNFAMMIYHRHASNALKVVAHGAIKPEFKVDYPKED